MSKRSVKGLRKKRRVPLPEEPLTRARLLQLYERAGRLAADGEAEEARRLYEHVRGAVADLHEQARIRCNLAALDAAAGGIAAAREGFAAALALDPECEPARLNAALLDADAAASTGAAESSGPGPVGSVPTAPAAVLTSVAAVEQSPTAVTSVGSGEDADGPVKVAVISLLFNWPSTGGGIFHTVELIQFLTRAGYAVRHFHARFDPWGVGDVSAPLPFASEALDFSAADWQLPTIQARFRDAVTRWAPDHVIITDSWSIKPHLAAALRDYSYLLRFQAMECLCPLNGVRLLCGPDGLRQCHNHQLADPARCRRCLAERGHHAGELHQAERALSAVDDPAYPALLEAALRNAAAVLVVNPLQQAMLGPYNPATHVVTAGMDPARFPPPEVPGASASPVRLLFAGLTGEPMKGFDVLRQACQGLWARRQDFELVATGEPDEAPNPFTRYVGWQSQEDLAACLRQADVVVLPTVAQEALGRTAVEAMAAGKPVVASRLGGLPFTVLDGATGLLCTPGDAADLEAKLERLLDDAALRHQFGAAGRRRFEEEYAWPVIVERHYRPLLDRRGAAATANDQVAWPDRGFRPVLPETDPERVAADLAALLGLDPAAVAAKLATYRSFHELKGYAQNFGERKTLCFAEAFALYVLLDWLRPRTLVELGTQHGCSTRRLLDAKNLLGLDTRVVCVDVADAVRHFRPDEAELVVGDVTGDFNVRVLDRYRPELIFWDVHPYPLLREGLAAALAAPRPPVVVIHDCGRGLCNPRMTLAREDPAVTSSTGVWERHVLAELCGLTDPLDPRLDAFDGNGFKLRVLDTPHGLGLLLPHGVRRSNEVSATPEAA